MSRSYLQNLDIALDPKMIFASLQGTNERLVSFCTWSTALAHCFSSCVFAYFGS